MHGEIAIGAPLLLGFLLTLVRVAGVFVFVPIPGVSTVVSPARVVLALSITLALYSEWPVVAAEISTGQFIYWISLEAALGAGIGLAAGFASEAFAVGAQAMGMHAGFAFASTIDPSTQADSTVLGVLSQITTGLLFFTLGLDREVIRVFARSLQTCPPGAFALNKGAAEHVLLAGSAMFSTGLRLALPVLAALLMIDISLALLGRINAQLHLLTIAFPAKMIVALVLLGWLALLFPTLYRGTFEATFRTAQGLIAR
jgi:flagellar biosynthetic protein FliR